MSPNRGITRNLAVVASVAVAALSTLSAAAVTYDFTTIQTSSGTPGGAAPYARLIVTPDGAGKVDFRFEVLSLAPTEFLSSLKFNIAGSARTPAISVSDKVQTGTFEAPTFNFSASPQTDAGLAFDFSLAFATSGSNGGAKRFTNGDIFEWTLSRTGLSVDDIDLPAMIHLQGIAGGGSAKIIASEHLSTTPQSDTVSVPDGGSTLLLLGLGLLGAGTFAARRR